MATPPIPDAVKQQTKERVEQKLREGYRPPGMTGRGMGAIAAAAAGEINSRTTYDTRVSKMRGTIYEPDWTIYRPARYQQPQPLSVLSPAMPERQDLGEPSGTGRRVLVIGDLHQDPRKEDRLQVLTWIARYASEQRFDRIIQVGDWSTWDSVSTHDKNDTASARFKPGVKDDQANLVASHQAWRRGIAEGYRPMQDFLQGNHENRLERFENAHPEAWQTYTVARDEAFAQFGWKSRPYGELFYVEGVGFTHHAINGAGRAFGGKTGPQRGANETTVPIVGGHTHRKQLHDAPKIGPQEVISMVEVGCAMPWGSMESYVQHSMTGWWWGVVPMTVQGGMITDIEFKSMISVRREFSDDGADVRSA